MTSPSSRRVGASKDHSMPPLVPSLAPASALLSTSDQPAPFPRPLRSYLELGALPTAVPCARLHARHLLCEWGLNGLAPDSELLVSELVTNAVQATAGHDEAAVRLRLSGDRTRVLIEVWEADPRPPAPKDLGEHGTPDPQTREDAGCSWWRR